MSSHFSVHFCTFHPRPVDLRVWTRNKQCGSISWIAPLLEMGKESSRSFPFLFFPSVVRRWADTGSAAQESRRYTGFHCAPIGEGEKRERVRQREKESQRAAGGWGRRAGEYSPGLPGGRRCATARASESAGAGKGTQGASQRQRWRIPKPAHLGDRAQLASGSARAGRRYVGEIPQPLPDYFTSPKWCRNSRPVDVFFPARPPLRSPPPPPPRISLSFSSMLSMTPLGTLASWVNTEEMFLGVRKGRRRVCAYWKRRSG